MGTEHANSATRTQDKVFMALAIFDLDNTLIAGDSDHRWGQFVCANGLANPDEHAARNDQFYRDYQTGDLDINAYLEFALSPIAGMTIAEVEVLQERFLTQCIEELLLSKALALLDTHRHRGDTLLIITATNSVVTAPIAKRLGVEHLIGSDAEIRDGRYTGRPTGIPSFQQGKVERLERWQAQRTASCGDVYNETFFYSDSHNDIPLLDVVDHPVVVDPDERLARYAEQRGWRIISLRD
jgi:HAD superfamily hydrolase (TIGR01490 family)